MLKQIKKILNDMYARYGATKEIIKISEIIEKTELNFQHKENIILNLQNDIKELCKENNYLKEQLKNYNNK